MHVAVGIFRIEHLLTILESSFYIACYPFYIAGDTTLFKRMLASFLGDEVLQSGAELRNEFQCTGPNFRLL